MTTAALDLGLLWPALIAGLLVTATHVPLGAQVLSRGIVFIDLGHGDESPLADRQRAS